MSPAASDVDIRFKNDATGQGAVITRNSLGPLITHEWFDPAYWGESADKIKTGGRGGAYVVQTPIGPLLLRQYLRGGLVAPIMKDRYMWHGGNKTRSFTEYHLTAEAYENGAPVPEPIAAMYWRKGRFYRAAILVQFLRDIQTFGAMMIEKGAAAPWEACGRLISRAHRKGLDHADLNAHNIVFNPRGQGWLIDFDRSAIRIPDTSWREKNLERLKRSVLKLAKESDGKLSDDVALTGYAKLKAAYDAAWARGI